MKQAIFILVMLLAVSVLRNVSTDFKFQNVKLVYQMIKLESLESNLDILVQDRRIEILTGIMDIIVNPDNDGSSDIYIDDGILLSYMEVQGDSCKSDFRLLTLIAEKFGDTQTKELLKRVVNYEREN